MLLLPNMEIEIDQKEICDKYNCEYTPIDSHFKLGVSRNFKLNQLPVNGLRHPIENDTCGWYIWSGEEFSEDPNFFVPVHISHIKDQYPIVYKYLALPEGYRFLIGDNGYEDVWEDKSLLNID